MDSKMHFSVILMRGLWRDAKSLSRKHIYIVVPHYHMQHYHESHSWVSERSKGQKVIKQPINSKNAQFKHFDWEDSENLQIVEVETYM